MACECSRALDSAESHRKIDAAIGVFEGVTKGEYDKNQHTVAIKVTRIFLDRKNYFIWNARAHIAPEDEDCPFLSSESKSMFITNIGDRGRFDISCITLSADTLQELEQNEISKKTPEQLEGETLQALKAECAEKHGMFGMGGGMGCAQPLPDGGKPCYGSADCGGHNCYYYDTNSPSIFETLIGSWWKSIGKKKGLCQKYEGNSSCKGGTIENGIVNNSVCSDP